MFRFALTHERRFLREGERAGWGVREREENTGLSRSRLSFRGRSNNMLNPSNIRGRTGGRLGSGYNRSSGGGAYRSNRADYSSRNAEGRSGDRNEYRNNNNNNDTRDPFRVKFGGPLSYN